MQWLLTKNKTITSFKSWHQNLIYVLSLDKNFVPFIEASWQNCTNPHRRLQNDGSSVPETQRLTAVQKNAHLEFLLGQIANSIVKNSVSLNDIWQNVELLYGFQSTGASGFPRP